MSSSLISILFANSRRKNELLSAATNLKMWQNINMAQKKEGGSYLLFHKSPTCAAFLSIFSLLAWLVFNQVVLRPEIKRGVYILNCSLFSILVCSTSVLFDRSGGESGELGASQVEKGRRSPVDWIIRNEQS